MDMTRSPRASHHQASSQPGLTQLLQAAMAVLPPILGGAPLPALEVGRTSRVVTPTQRPALAVRDGGWGSPTVLGPGLAPGPPSVALAGRRPPRPG
jgi:hypothetical protein